MMSSTPWLAAQRRHEVRRGRQPTLALGNKRGPRGGDPIFWIVDRGLKVGRNCLNVGKYYVAY